MAPASGASPATEEVRRQVRDFLLLEAELLDDGRFDDWLALLAPEVDYRMPVRTTRERKDGTGFATDAFHFAENRHRLELRVARLSSGSAWAEEPPSRTRHFVTNVRARAGSGADEVGARSNLLLYRTRGDARHHDLLAAERHDVLQRVGGAWKLAKRIILLDQTTVSTHNLSIFL
jgi:3-phenylpropionate/cinnamic acid dioxygenase small subunit